MSKGNNRIPKIGITIGDLNGVGAELILNTFKEGNFLQFFTPVIYASAPTIIYHKNHLGIKQFSFQTIDNADGIQPKRVNLINAWEGEVKIEIGVPDRSTGSAALQSLQKAAADLKEGKIDGLVTCPINKETIQSSSFKFPGHTEYLGNLFETDNYLMMMVGEQLKLATVTGHIALKEVPEAVTKKKILKALKILNQSLIEDFGIERPKIAVLGLNPHAGENGLLGNEESENIQPAIDEANRQKILAFGPYPADGFFGTCMHSGFDAVLTMYHDQGLVPFKLLEFENGVNYTAGLPALRTSPDHGTAYQIAGKGIANTQSFKEAMFLISKIIRNRAMHSESTAQPLENKKAQLKDD
ncbi:MAG: 4-hydroxythreonine-4-phosphate dehydrogenase PdxA [Bacteroidetes bacterium]|nr:4-hydroxythreonine-4-phosphate dehydrogenase PdxA [Bacteroidota bacterium]